MWTLEACVHTNAQWVFLELWCEVRSLGQAEDVSFQHIPAHFIIEGVTELCWNLRRKQKVLNNYGMYQLILPFCLNIPSFCLQCYKCLAELEYWSCAESFLQTPWSPQGCKQHESSLSTSHHVKLACQVGQKLPFLFSVRSKIKTNVYLRVWWRWSPALVQSFGSQKLGLPGKRLPASPIGPSSHRVPSSEVWVGLARKPKTRRVSRRKYLNYLK